jgi:hypothetical protein
LLFEMLRRPPTAYPSLAAHRSASARITTKREIDEFDALKAAMHFAS